MKIRNDFVTNSSSSSFILACAKIKDKNAFKNWLKEEYGNTGIKDLDNFILLGSDILSERRNNEFIYTSNEDWQKIEPNKHYLFVDEDIEGSPTCSAGILYGAALRKQPFIELLFSGHWSGFNG